jgi:hypothetical protein
MAGISSITAIPVLSASVQTSVHTGQILDYVKINASVSRYSGILQSTEEKEILKRIADCQSPTVHLLISEYIPASDAMKTFIILLMKELDVTLTLTQKKQMLDATDGWRLKGTVSKLPVVSAAH